MVKLVTFERRIGDEYKERKEQDMQTEKESKRGVTERIQNGRTGARTQRRTNIANYKLGLVTVSDAPLNILINLKKQKIKKKQKKNNKVRSFDLFQNYSLQYYKGNENSNSGELWIKSSSVPHVLNGKSH